MTERPILFSAPMVRALLEGRKTQTRRIVKPQPSRDLYHLECLPSGEWRDEEISLGVCPYGRPGDRLWVKETHRLFDKVWTPDAMDTAVQYRADMRARILSGRYVGADEASGNWRPSIFMRRWMSRITLEITAVRVERLNDISEADAIAEGVDSTTPFKWRPDEWQNKTPNVARYAGLWESINGAGSWAANPWVWAIEFRRIQP
jgi:hypothetical protein